MCHGLPLAVPVGAPAGCHWQWTKPWHLRPKKALPALADTMPPPHHLRAFADWRLFLLGIFTLCRVPVTASASLSACWRPGGRERSHRDCLGLIMLLVVGATALAAAVALA